MNPAVVHFLFQVTEKIHIKTLKEMDRVGREGSHCHEMIGEYLQDVRSHMDGTVHQQDRFSLSEFFRSSQPVNVREENCQGMLISFTEGTWTTLKWSEKLLNVTD
jgi:hypothetical protein